MVLALVNQSIHGDVVTTTRCRILKMRSEKIINITPVKENKSQFCVKNFQHQASGRIIKK